MQTKTLWEYVKYIAEKIATVITPDGIKVVGSTGEGGGGSTEPLPPFVGKEIPANVTPSAWAESTYVEFVAASALTLGITLINNTDQTLRIKFGTETGYVQITPGAQISSNTAQAISGNRLALTVVGTLDVIRTVEA